MMVGIADWVAGLYEEGAGPNPPSTGNRGRRKGRALQCARTNPLPELLLISRPQAAEPIVVTC